MKLAHALILSCVVTLAGCSMPVIPEREPPLEQLPSVAAANCAPASASLLPGAASGAGDCGCGVADANLN